MIKRSFVDDAFFFFLEEILFRLLISLISSFVVQDF